jgi:hypothetical protein
VQQERQDPLVQLAQLVQLAFRAYLLLDEFTISKVQQVIFLHTKN